tara:strand:- start:176 stop:1576 length:1401 start_codon:yes stop_codon:yes gene_type:complete
MRKTPSLLWAALLALPAGAAEKTAPPTHKVQPAPFKIEVQLDGRFSAQKVHEITLRPKSWTDLSVLSAVPHGATVKKGDPLVKLDLEKLDRKIRDTKIDLELSKLDLALAKADLEYAEATIPLDLTAVERAYHEVKEDLDRYQKVTKPYNVKSAERTVISAANYLANAEEELKQLKKMYEADDVAEDTEEIILKRAQHAVDRARHSLEGARIRSETSLKITIPRESTAKKEGELRKRLELVKARVSNNADLKKKQLAVEKQEIAHSLAIEALTKLEADRDRLTPRAPAGGTVFYGTFSRGAWSGLKLVEPKLRKHGKLTTGTAFMTVVEPGPLRIHALLDEKDLRHVEAGDKGNATAKADPDRNLSVTVASVSRVPVDVGKFEVILESQAGGILVPGMACMVKLVPYKNPKALAVPAKAVFEEDDATYVWLKGGKKRVVTTGRSFGGKTAILKGLKAGDEILLEKP